MLLFLAMGSGGPHVYCHILADVVGRLVRGLEVLRGLAGLGQRPGEP